jgi:hypothetical protein
MVGLELEEDVQYGCGGTCQLLAEGVEKGPQLERLMARMRDARRDCDYTVQRMTSILDTCAGAGAGRLPKQRKETAAACASGAG